MDKQSTAAFVLIGIILVVWLYFNSPTPPPPAPTQDSTLVQKDTLKEKKLVESKTEQKEKTNAGNEIFFLSFFL